MEDRQHQEHAPISILINNTCTEPDEVLGPMDAIDQMPKYELHNDRLGLFSRASLASSELISDSYLLSNEKQLRALEI